MSTNLDSDFGSVRPPNRIDDWEKDAVPVSLSNLEPELGKKLNDLLQIANANLFKHAARAKTYIWAMDERGEIKIAVEEVVPPNDETPHYGYPRRRWEHPSTDKKLGHPTLLNGGCARIAGELIMDESAEELIWYVNVSSGRYCSENPPTKVQIANIAQKFKSSGIDVEIDEL